MRTNKVILVAGNRNTGKTDFTKELVIGSQLPKRLIIDTFDSPPWHNLKTWKHPEMVNSAIPVLPLDALPAWKNGLYRMFSGDVDEMIAYIQQYITNALLVFEDATKYIGSVLSKDMRKFILDSKQKNLDIIFVFHSLAAIPPELVRVADYLALFKTNEGPPSITKYPFPDIPQVMEKLRSSPNQYIHHIIALH